MFAFICMYSFLDVSVVQIQIFKSNIYYTPQIVKLNNSEIYKQICKKCSDGVLVWWSCKQPAYLTLALAVPPLLSHPFRSLSIVSIKQIANMPPKNA